MSNTKTKGRPVVLGGGARRGAFHVGLLRLLERHEVAVSFYMGASIGSVVAALYTNGKTPAQIGSLLSDELFHYGVFGWLNPLNWVRSIVESGIDGRSPVCFTWIKMLTPPINPVRYVTGGTLDVLPAMERLVRNEKLTPQPNLRIVAYDLLRRKTVVFGGRRRIETKHAIYVGSNYNLALALAASCCIAIPLMMRPIACRVNGEPFLLIDPGLIGQANPVHLVGRNGILAKLMDDLPSLSTKRKLVTVKLCDSGEGFLSRITTQDLLRMERQGYVRAEQHLAAQGVI